MYFSLGFFEDLLKNFEKIIKIFWEKSQKYRIFEIFWSREGGQNSKIKNYT